MRLFRDIGRFLEMGVIAHGHQLQCGVSSKLRYFGTLRTLYTLSDRAHDGEPVRNGAH
jgi:hypothetical protein